MPSALMLSSPWRTRPARPLALTRAVATTGVRSTARPAQMMGDWCRQVSWLTAHARRLRLPAGCPAVALGATLAAYSCGGSRGFEDKPRTAFPFHPPQLEQEPRQDRHAHPSKQSGSLAVNSRVAATDDLRSTVVGGATPVAVSDSRRWPTTSPKNTLQGIYLMRYVDGHALAGGLPS